MSAYEPKHHSVKCQDIVAAESKGSSFTAVTKGKGVQVVFWEEGLEIRGMLFTWKLKKLLTDCQREEQFKCVLKN